MKRYFLFPILIPTLALGFVSFVNNQSKIKLTSKFAHIPSVQKNELLQSVNSDCTFDGFKLYGKVQIVESFPDIKIQWVDAFPDLKVKWVDAFPDDCGEWQEVTSFPDIKVQVVTSFPDVKVQEVTSFPGL